MGRQCPGELFDGTPCNGYQYFCRTCDTYGCFGDGCEWQAFEAPECDGCGSVVEPALVLAA